jgi:hypothetical protein
MPRRRFKLAFELLEDRLAPATYGVPWPDPGHLTLSFVRDGTTFLGLPGQSQLFNTLGTANASAWETTILQAFQTWAVHANINIGVVADDGAPMGSPGPIQGDTQFGDIRIAAYPLASDVMAVAFPFDYTAGTWSGDVLLNPSAFANFAQNPNLGELFTVMQHEAGHVFGLPDSSDPTSAMYEVFSVPWKPLGSQDVAALQAIYGAPAPDPTDNNSVATATQLNSSSSSVAADISSLNDVDYYKFKATGTDGNVTVTVQTAGISLLVPSLKVWDSSTGQVFRPVVSTGPNNDVSLSFAASPGDTYVIEVGSGTSDVFGMGGYQLDLTTQQSGHNGTPNGGGASQQSLANRAGSTLGTAINLQPQVFQSNSNFDYFVPGTLASAGDATFYTFRTPKSSAGQSTVLTATVWATGSSTLAPQITVYDAQGNVVPAQVLSAEGGTYTVQVANASPSTKYFVEVSGANPAAAASNTGTYDLAIAFGSDVSQIETLVSNGTVDASQPQSGGSLTTNEGELFHYIVSVSGTAGMGQLTVYSGNTVVQTLQVTAGSTRSATIALLPGNYTLVFTSVDGTPLTYTLQAIALSDPIGPAPIDTTLQGDGHPTVGLPFLWQSGLLAFLATGGVPGTGTGPSSPGTTTSNATNNGTVAATVAGTPTGNPSGPVTNNPGTPSGSTVNNPGTPSGTTNPGSPSGSTASNPGAPNNPASNNPGTPSTPSSPTFNNPGTSGPTLNNPGAPSNSAANNPGTSNSPTFNNPGTASAAASSSQPAGNTTSTANGGTSAADGTSVATASAAHPGAVAGSPAGSGSLLASAGSAAAVLGSATTATGSTLAGENSGVRSGEAGVGTQISTGSAGGLGTSGADTALLASNSPSEGPAFLPNEAAGMPVMAAPDSYAASLIPAGADLPITYPTTTQETTAPSAKPLATTGRGVEYLAVALGGAVVLRALSPHLLGNNRRKNELS